MFDYAQYDYVEMEFPNLFAEVEKGVDPDKVYVTLAPYVSHLVHEVCRQRPNWSLVLKGGFCQGARNVISSVTVYEKKEQLGTIGIASHLANRPYSISNDRIRSARSRGSASTTSDLKKAVKLVLKNFGSKSVVENMESVKSGISGLMNEVSNKTYSAVSRSNTIMQGIQNDVRDHNWPAMKEFLLKHAIDRAHIATIEGYEQQMLEHKQVRDMNTDLQKTRGTYVMLNGSDYHVYDAKEQSLELYASEDLPPHLKRSIGLLKLLSDKSVLGEVGMRLNETSYYVISTAEKGEE